MFTTGLNARRPMTPITNLNTHRGLTTPSTGSTQQSSDPPDAAAYAAARRDLMAQLGLGDDSVDNISSSRKRKRMSPAEKKALKHATMSQSDVDADELKTIGRLFGKLCAPFTPVDEIFAAGAKFEKSGLASLTSAEKFKAFEYDSIMTRWPHLRDIMARVGARVVKDALRINRGDMLSEDVQRVKNNIVQWHEWQPLMSAAEAKNKKNRGLNHDGMAQLLLPQEEDWNDASVKAKYKPNGRVEGGAPIPPKLLPKLCFPLDDPQEKNGPGFMQNDVAISVARGLLIGPSIAADRSRRAASGVLAVKHNISQVTSPFMSYAMCLTRFGISHETRFGPYGDQGFNYVAMYVEILKTMDQISNMGEHGEGVEMMQDLVDLWNRAIFTDVVYSPSEDESSEDEDVSTVKQRYGAFIADKRSRLEQELAQ